MLFTGDAENEVTWLSRDVVRIGDALFPISDSLVCMYVCMYVNELRYI